MRPAQVLLVTAVGRSGEVDIAVRADVAVGELVVVLDDVVGAPAATPVGDSSPSSPSSAPSGSAAPRLALESTLLGAGVVDGDVIELSPADGEGPRLLSPQRPGIRSYPTGES